MHSNPKTMPVWALGTASLRTDGHTRTACIAMRCHAETWLFDAGEDAQRQFLKIATSPSMAMKYLRIARIFITSLDGPHLFGLPALLCMLVRRFSSPLTLVSVPLCWNPWRHRLAQKR